MSDSFEPAWKGAPLTGACTSCSSRAWRSMSLRSCTSHGSDLTLASTSSLSLPWEIAWDTSLSSASAVATLCLRRSSSPLAPDRHASHVQGRSPSFERASGPVGVRYIPAWDAITSGTESKTSMPQ